MESSWIITIALLIFIAINFLYYKSMNGYVRKAFGKKWLRVYGNKLYFWQSSIFVSSAATVFIMYVLKWASILTF
ncbi:MAG: hypothetical protein CMH46_05195 [Muricauda sp.]|nr:hypothetical protein [Allomuricauda sp.]|tara:strand:+ start:13843 stop:14067 length:225 start_codon:yes stop_codon:yes gene_type:complete